MLLRIVLAFISFYILTISSGCKAFKSNQSNSLSSIDKNLSDNQNYQVKLIDSPTTGSSRAPEFLDLDGDGAPDAIDINGWMAQVVVKLSQSKNFAVNFGADVFTHSISTRYVKFGNDRYSSILIAVSRRTENGSVHNIRDPNLLLNQILLRNDQKGLLTQVNLNIRMHGRDVDCRDTRDSKLVCFFAGYHGQSALYEVGSEGRVNNITSQSGLPFPTAEGPFGTNGRHMMSGRWIDLDQDGDWDLVSVGQHSDILFAKNSSNSYQDFKFTTEYVDPVNDYTT
ncbi:MAG: hypothetical protein NT027_01600 [Proteobacteria bacterium]|nr:hypothetical protein [Pseudomonadota bacterium]